MWKAATSEFWLQQQWTISIPSNFMPTHRYLCDILADIDASGCGEHALVSYVKGVCLNKQGAKRAAMAALAHSVTVFPLNWSAWLEMLTISKKVA